MRTLLASVNWLDNYENSFSFQAKMLIVTKDADGNKSFL